jgi:CHAD domain-containing protein
MTRSGVSGQLAADREPGAGLPAAEPGVPAAAPEDPAPLPAVVAAVNGPAVARAGALRADDPWPEAGRRILGFHLARMLARVPGVIAGEDAEEVHAMRVAARRMRAAWRVFGDGFERGEVRRYRGELRDIGASLGAVRDLDVLIGILVGYRDQRSDRQRAGLEPLLAAWRSEREARRVELVAVIGSERFAAFIHDYQAFAGTPGRAALVLPPHSPGLVRNRMPATIWAAYQDVWAFDGDLQAADLATLHQLRIAAKWLRYTLEFVREPLEPEATALIRPVVALQDHLGDQHDQHVAAELAREFVATAACSPSELKSIGRFTAYLDGDVERMRRTIRSTWPPIVGSRYRRSLGRAVARL